jgi:excisionase family DNA binding protein
MNNKLLTVQELADYLSVKPCWVYTKARSGEMPKITIGKYIRFDMEKVLAWLQKQNSINSIGTS